MTWLVEMQNHVDRRDDEVFKVRAASKARARTIARSASRGRFSVGRVVPWRGGSKHTRELASDFRTYCTMDLP